MDELTSWRVVLLGKTGVGKSSLANTIFGEEVFKISHLPISETSASCAETKYVDGKSMTLIDTHSFFDTCGSETLLKAEIMRCITECAPGPHAFLIVLKVEKFTTQERDVIKQICQYFSEDALKHAAVVFTHGDQLPEETKIDEFVSQNKALSDLVKKCGGRCHVVDNKYWKNNGEDYRSNQFQVENLLRTIDKIIQANNGNYYTNEMLNAVKREIQREEENIAQSVGNMSQEQIRNEAKKSVFNTLVIRVAGVATGVLLGAFLGVAGMFKSMFSNAQELQGFTATTVKHTVVAAAQKGGLEGFQRGYEAAEGAETPGEAIQRAAEAVWNQTAASTSGPVDGSNQKQLQH
ncbi:GTPase IMAP family member 7-like [Anabas testudineus]|uniref:GTPase IMAP family member 7-like n=1 Tax=Anabas testudineus TaxID=64144 RepID=UPI000E458A01|nr:GTPase IMAP family member 7-like [Anabas testudineus]